MKQLTIFIGLGIGLSLGAGLLYALYTSETARLLIMFLLGALTFGGTILITVLLVNRQWTRVVGEHRTTHNHRYPLYPPPAPISLAVQRQQDLLPPLDTSPWGKMGLDQDIDDEVVA